jgi:hypothetical protein
MPPKSAAQIDRERKRWEHDQQQADYMVDELFAADMEFEVLEPIMDAIPKGGTSNNAGRARRVIIVRWQKRGTGSFARSELFNCPLANLYHFQVVSGFAMKPRQGWRDRMKVPPSVRCTMRLRATYYALTLKEPPCETAR